VGEINLSQDQIALELGKTRHDCAHELAAGGAEVEAQARLRQDDSSVTRMASISRAWANAMTFLRSGRSFLEPGAVSLNTPTMRWPARLANARDRVPALAALIVGADPAADGDLPI
jgi:hypothetical protein